MKKLIYAFGALALIFSSCSSDDSSDNSNNNGNYLLKKEIITDEEGIKTTYNFKYNGNKLVSIIDNDTESSDIYVTYTGDLISQIDYKFSDKSIEQTEKYGYDSNGRLSSYIFMDIDAEIGNREVYTYNGDGTVSFKEYVGDLTEQIQLNSYGKIYFVDGEVRKIEKFNTDDVLLSSTTYAHDSANGAMKNITGWSKASSFNSSEGESILHNITSEDDASNGITTYTYTYNSANYPLTCVEEFGKLKTTTEFFY